MKTTFFKVTFDNFSVLTASAPVFTENYGIRIDSALNADREPLPLQAAILMSESGKVDFLILDGQTHLYVDKDAILSVFREVRETESK